MNPSPKPDGRVRAAWCLMALVLSGSLSGALAGCLFPPVASPLESDAGGDNGTGRDPSPVVYRQELMQNTTDGVIDAGVGDVDQDVRPHRFDMPARLDVVRVILDWDDELYDLDVAARLVPDAARPDAASWEDADGNGSLGDPDSPVMLVVSDPSMISFEAPSQLRVEVSAKQAVDVPYTLTVLGRYRVPVQQ